MAAALARNRKCGGQTERRQRVAAGKIAKWFLDLIAAQPDLTLDEVIVAKKKARIPGSRSAVGRFFLSIGSRTSRLLSNGVARIPVGDGGICSPVLSTDAKRWPSGCIKEYGFGPESAAEGSSSRRLAALDYIHSDFCPGLPDPSLIVKPF